TTASGEPFGGVGNTHSLAQSSGNEPNMSCPAFLRDVNQTIKNHPDWKTWLDQARHNESQFIENCQKEGGNTGEVLRQSLSQIIFKIKVQSFIDHQKDLLGCPEAHSRMTIIAIIFIVAFIISIIALAVVSVLYYRK
uniref:Conserved plasma membrane protein n=1 Tax=Meloidogyne hapla TaxID=6305 RepID=A0A1I8BEE9_MELHA